MRRPPLIRALQRAGVAFIRSVATSRFARDGMAGFVDNKMGDNMENMKCLSNEVVSADTERYLVCQLRSIAY